MKKLPLFLLTDDENFYDSRGKKCSCYSVVCRGCFSSSCGLEGCSSSLSFVAARWPLCRGFHVTINASESSKVELLTTDPAPYFRLTKQAIQSANGEEKKSPCYALDGWMDDVSSSVLLSPSFRFFSFVTSSRRKGKKKVLPIFDIGHSFGLEPFRRPFAFQFRWFVPPTRYQLYRGL